jgi:8-hydroxy-5-deazaflavin:NADPH oxidoreductase
VEIGIIGGTGDLGTALAVHLARQYKVVIGSRAKSKAESAISQILTEKGERDYLKKNLEAAENRDAVSRCDFLIATVPQSTALESMKNLASSFRGDKVLVSAVASVSKSGDEFHSDFSEYSITQQIQHLLPDSINLATAFQTVPANILYKEKPISADVLVACDNKQSYAKVAEVVSSISGLRPLYAGSLKQSGPIEGLTAMLLNIAINNRLKSPTIKLNSF